MSQKRRSSPRWGRSPDLVAFHESRRLVRRIVRFVAIRLSGAVLVLTLFLPAAARAGCRSFRPRNRQPLHLRAVHAPARSRKRRPAGDAGIAGGAGPRRDHRPPPALRPGPPQTRLSDRADCRAGWHPDRAALCRAGRRGDRVDIGFASADQRPAPGHGDGFGDHGRAGRVAGWSTRNRDRDLDQCGVVCTLQTAPPRNTAAHGRALPPVPARSSRAGGGTDRVAGEQRSPGRPDRYFARWAAIPLVPLPAGSARAVCAAYAARPARLRPVGPRTPARRVTELFL